MGKLSTLAMTLFAILTVPIMALNFLGGIVGGVWLAFLGEWSLLLTGLAIIFFGHFIVSILLLPGMLLAMPSIWAFNKGFNVLGAILAIPTVLWTYLLLAGWCAFYLMIGISYTHGEHLVPVLLWGYAVATSPWTYLAQVEARSDKNAPAIMTSAAAQFGCIIAMIDVLFSQEIPSRGEILFVLGIPLFLAFLFQAFLAIAMTLEERRYRVL